MSADYTGYVIAAYGLAAAGLLGLVLWAFLDRRSARDSLARAERLAGQESGHDA